jgi:hypothetical protein
MATGPKTTLTNFDGALHSRFYWWSATDYDGPCG